MKIFAINGKPKKVSDVLCADGNRRVMEIVKSNSPHITGRLSYKNEKVHGYAVDARWHGLTRTVFIREGSQDMRYFCSRGFSFNVD